MLADRIKLSAVFQLSSLAEAQTIVDRVRQQATPPVTDGVEVKLSTR